MPNSKKLTIKSNYFILSCSTKFFSVSLFTKVIITTVNIVLIKQKPMNLFKHGLHHQVMGHHDLKNQKKMCQQDWCIFSRFQSDQEAKCF